MKYSFFFCLLLLIAGSVLAQAPLPPAPPPYLPPPTIPPAPSSAPPPVPVGQPPQHYTPWQPLPSVDELRARLEKLEKDSAAGEIPSDPRNLHLLRFKLEQGRLFLERLRENNWGWPDEIQRYFNEALTIAEHAARFNGDAASTPAQMHERVYFAATDGSVQPYWVYLPKDYSPQRQYPLAIFLHGYDPAITKIVPWLPAPDVWEAATERGFILAVPYGRRNSDFVNIGEDDTVRVSDEVQAHYNVDPKRVFLLGTSMGGYGAYVVGLHQPQRWAGVAVMCGRTDFYLWFNLQREALPAWKRVLYDADDPRRLKLNALHLPFYIQHGSLDTIVPVEHSRRFVSDLEKLKYAVRYSENPGGDHFIYFSAENFANAFDWMLGVRKIPPPPRVQYTTGTLRDNQSRWVTIDAFERYDTTATIEAEVRPGNVLEVKLQNVAAFTLNPPSQLLGDDRPIVLSVNGHKTGTFPLGQPVRWRAAQKSKVQITEYSGSQALPVPLVKTPIRSGPIKNVYRDPFLLVYGTQQDGLDAVRARRFAEEWFLFADGRPPIKADTDVTVEDFARYNLILFGTSQSNKLLAEVVSKLPLELLPGGFRLGRKTYNIPNRLLGAQLCYPSPWNAERMIVVQSGLYWGDALTINHKFDLLPEYIVYSQEVDPSDSTNHALAAGFFDHQWQLPNSEAR